MYKRTPIFEVREKRFSYARENTVLIYFLIEMLFWQICNYFKNRFTLHLNPFSAIGII